MRDILVLPPLRLLLLWHGDEVCRIELGWAGQLGREDSQWESPRACEAERILSGCVDGTGPCSGHLRLAWHRVGDFAGKVLRTLYDRVAPGEWISYGGLAHLCGVPGGARAVGRVMRENPWPLVIPCHRVLRRDGNIGGFSSGVEMKRYLLAREETSAISGEVGRRATPGRNAFPVLGTDSGSGSGLYCSSEG